MQETKEIFSRNLKMELQLRSISQGKLAKALDVSQQTVNEWTKGECLPSLATFRKLCIILKADPQILLDLDIETEIPFTAFEILGHNPNTGGGCDF